MRDTWLVPLGLVLGGTAICAIAYLVFAPLAVAMRYIVDSLTFYGVLAVIWWAAFRVHTIREMVDQLILVLPFIGPAERELTMNRFFHAMNLLYSTGGRRVEEMIRLAADSAENLYLRGDLLRAAAIIESGGTIGEAFAAPAMLPFDYKTTIVAGDEGGNLETAFDTVCRASAESVQSHLVGVHQFFFRVVAGAVAFSTMMALYSLITMRG
jgi:type II secretory pathway component PulF